MQNLPGRLNAIDARHLQVHQDHIRLQLGCQFDGLLPCCCFPYNLGTGRGREQCPHSFTKQRVIICDQYAERFHTFTPLAREA
jgi:hypothetical protein